MNTQTAIPTLDDWHPIPALVAAYPDKLSEASLRWYLRHRDANGLAPAVRRLGHRLLISKTRFEAWLANGQAT
jgi:hypothetical protein